MAEGEFGWTSFLIVALAIAAFVEFDDLTLALLVACALFVLAVRADDLLGLTWSNLAGITNFFLLRW